MNLNEDPQLSEMLLYMIKEGRTTVGKLKSDSAHDIQLTGALIADQHWWEWVTSWLMELVLTAYLLGDVLLIYLSLDIQFIDCLVKLNAFAWF